MEIRNQSVGPINSEPRRVDVTRPNRDAIKEQTPLPPPMADAVTPEPTSDQAALAKRIKNAREQHAEKLETRTHNARSEHNDALAARIQNAREDYVAGRIQNARSERAERVDNARTTEQADKAERVKNAREATSRDELDISVNARALFGAADDANQARAERVERMKRLFENGTLHTEERADRAAGRMLDAE